MRERIAPMDAKAPRGPIVLAIAAVRDREFQRIAWGAQARPASMKAIPNASRRIRGYERTLQAL